MSEHIRLGASHPNRPLPSHEVFITARRDWIATLFFGGIEKVIE